MSDRVTRVTRLLWLALFFEIGFLLMAAPLHVDGFVRSVAPLVVRWAEGGGR